MTAEQSGSAEEPMGALPPTSESPDAETPEAEPATPEAAAESSAAPGAEAALAAVEEPAPEPEPVWRPPPVPQPEPWKPKDGDLDPTSDSGWEKATKHELRAIRPEDVAYLTKTDPEFAAAYARATADGIQPTADEASNVATLPVAADATALAPSEPRWRPATRRVKSGLEAT